jgi:hypothetical protein
LRETARLFSTHYSTMKSVETNTCHRVTDVLDGRTLAGLT